MDITIDLKATNNDGLNAILSKGGEILFAFETYRYAGIYGWQSLFEKLWKESDNARINTIIDAIINIDIFDLPEDDLQWYWFDVVWGCYDSLNALNHQQKVRWYLENLKTQFLNIWKKGKQEHFKKHLKKQPQIGYRFLLLEKNKTTESYKKIRKEFLQLIKREIKHNKSTPYEHTRLLLLETALIFETDSNLMQKRRKQINKLTTVSETTKQQTFQRAVKFSGEAEITQFDLSRQAVMTSILAQPLLQSYQIDHAIDLWRLIKKKPLHLQLAIQMHQIGWGLSFPLFLFFLYLTNAIKVIRNYLFWTFLLFLVTTIGYGIFYFFKEKGFRCGQLFHPRIAGAILVGLSILLLTPEGWELAHLPLGNYLLIIVINLSLSVLFMYMKVYHVILNSGHDFAPAQTQYKIKTQGEVSLFQETIFKRVMKLWNIAFLEAILFSFLTIGLFSPLYSAPATCIIAHDIVTWRILPRQSFSYFDFVFSAKLLSIWASSSLLIASFAQWLWDDHPITEL